MRKFIAYSLLMAFGILLVPRGFVHDCDHHEKTEMSSFGHPTGDVDNNHFDENCFACDYDIDLAEEPFSFIYRFQKPSYSVSQEIIIGLAHPDEFGADCLRGPPNA